MKKFHVKDEDGEVFEVEELDEEIPASESKPEVNDDNGLFDDEISALKGLAAIAPKLMKLVENTADACEDEDKEELDDECEDPKADDALIPDAQATVYAVKAKHEKLVLEWYVRANSEREAFDKVKKQPGHHFDTFVSAKIVKERAGMHIIDDSPEVDDEDEQIEEVIDTDEETKPRDSKKSFGAIERKKKAKDSIEDAIDVETAWAKRYGGNK